MNKRSPMSVTNVNNYSCSSCTTGSSAGCTLLYTSDNLSCELASDLCCYNSAELGPIFNLVFNSKENKCYFRMHLLSFLYELR